MRSVGTIHRRLRLSGFALLAALALPHGSSAQTFGVYREMWTNLASGTLGALTNTAQNPNWPTNPVAALSAVFTNFETELNSSRLNYGQRLRAFIVPPVSGSYMFWISGDDTTKLSLGGREDPSNATAVCWGLGWTNPREWTKETNQQSASIFMERGCRYYVEALMAQGGGGDNFAVRWQMPDGAIEEPMNGVSSNGTLMIPYRGIDSPPGIFRQPAVAYVAQNSNALFTVIVTNGSPVQYQWQRNATNVVGATKSLLVVSNAQPAMMSDFYTCVASNPAGVVTSTAGSIVLGVPPWIAVQPQSATVTVGSAVSFSVTASSSTNLIYQWQKNGANVTNGGAISGATTSNLIFGTTVTNDTGNYQVIVSNVFGCITSSVAVLNVGELPVILNHPQSRVVTNGLAASLGATASGSAPLFYQWLRNGGSMTNGGNISGVTATNLLFNPVTTNNSASYSLLVTNAYGTATSSNAVLTVVLDTVPPSTVRAYNTSPTNMQLFFSETMDPATATNAANYVFTNGGIGVSRVVLNSSSTTVTLTTTPLSMGSNYWIVINNLRDAAIPPNVIATNSIVGFVALPYVPEDIGGPAFTTVVAVVSNGLDVTSGGSGTGGTSDQFGFSWQSRSGDFDVSLRLAGLGLSDVWAKAGLMARETLTTNSRYTASFATPSMVGNFFEWRDSAGAAGNKSGSFPANFPESWLRLKRAGNLFSGYASYDGASWTLLGSATIAMSNTVYLGLALTSRNTNQPSTAQFRDIADMTGSVVIATDVFPHETIGPSSRKTPLVFSEIMYKPAPRTDTNNLEFIEIYNSNPWFHDISRYRIVAGDLEYTFPTGMIMAGGAYLVIAASPENMQAVHGITNVLGPYTGRLKTSDTLQLIDEAGGVLLTVPYADNPPWPRAADGVGHSLVLANPTFGEADPRAWDISEVMGGSPGVMECFQPDPLRNVVINEFLAHTDPPDVDFIELYNHANSSVDISGCILTDNPSTNLYVIPPGTIIGARGFYSCSETNMNFALSSAGATIYLKNPAQTRVLDAVQFNGQENGVSSGRWPDGAKQIYRMQAKTRGASNSVIRISDVVINEIMYNPISRNDDDQFIELFNRGTNSVNLGGWKLDDGISFTFPTNTTFSPGAYLVVARNAIRLRTNYTNLNLSNCLGDFGGKLAHGGERIALTMPDEVVSTNGITNIIHITMCEVTYGTGGRWGRWSDGGGSSLELIDPDADTRLAPNWADSDDTAKSTWTNIECIGTLDNGQNWETWIAHAQLGQMDVGECLVDDVEIYASTNVQNLVANPGFETGVTNWSPQGCHVRSGIETGGCSGAYSLHVRASSRVWTGANSCELDLLTNSMASGQQATMRFKARWLHGWPEVLLRLNGNWLEATGNMPVPTNLGTPALPNSRLAGNAGPAIFDVTHTPPSPATNQPVVVTARVHDPNGLQSLSLRYRIDPSTNLTSVAMKDDGTGGDVIAGDGTFSATIPAQGTGKIAAFDFVATDTPGASTRFPALLSDGAPVRECLVMFGDGAPVGSFGIYRLWITQTNATRWSNLSDLSNESHDCTMVNGNRVIYNMQARFAGSPYHQSFTTPYGNLCHYKWTFNEDDRFLGATSFNKIHQPGNGAGDDNSIQREQLAHTFLRTLGVPWLNRRYVAVYVNGNRRGTLMEDAQTPDSDVVDERWPDDADGFLYKMQPWFEFAPGGASSSFQNKSWCNLMPYTTTGGAKKMARYRWNYMIRQTADSASNYTNVFALVDAANSPAASFVANMNNIADMENWMRVFAANHAAGNWDSFGAQNSQNLYGYIGTKRVKYSLLMWDYNIVIGNGSWSPGAGLFTLNGQDSNMTRIYNEPVFRRMYWRALQELVNGPLDAANSGPLIDAKYDAFIASGVNVSENPNTNIKGWLTSARSSIATQLAAENTTNFTVNTAITTNNNVVTLTGTAPPGVATLWINGAEWPVRWTSVTSWSASYVLQPGTNVLGITGIDIRGQPVTGASNTLTTVYSGVPASPTGLVVISEIMYKPSTPDAEFVELYNTSGTWSFDLSGWRLNGLSYTFPAGSMIGPGSFLTVAANRLACIAAYGPTNNTPLGEFTGSFDPDGETISLLMNDAQTTVVDRVRYEAAAPWPVVTNGISIQAIDLTNDNSRVSNWGIGVSNAPVVSQWVYTASTGTVTGTNLYLYLLNAGGAYIDDVRLVLSNQDVGTSIISNGGFESVFSPWTNANYASSAITTNFKHSGTSCLSLAGTIYGFPTIASVVQRITPAPTNGTPCTLSYWYLQGTNSLSRFCVLLSGGGVSNSANPFIAPTTNTAFVTQGITNSVRDRLPAYPFLWLNEVQADNVSGPVDNNSERDPWVELFNSGTGTVSLAGLYLSDSYTNLLRWSFPTNATIASNEFKVIWCDAQTNQTATNALHTNFRLPAGSGRVAISRLVAGRTQIVDYLTYTNVPANWSYGDVPDGQPFFRTAMFFATPGGTNNGASRTLTVSINEWLADNTNTLADPADGDFEDWFELFNPGTNSADLRGFYLTDSFTNKFQFQIPNDSRWIIPPGGFLLAWADNETGQNNVTNRTDLHVNFKLSKDGESIGLFAPDGSAIDAVTFGAQTSNVSEGRYQDGAPNIFSMPPTPRTNNTIINTAPILGPLVNRHVHLGQTLGFIVPATDREQAVQTLAFNIEPGAPAGTAINPSTGLFTWTVTNVAAGTTNPVTIRVTDDGAPPLSTTGTLTVIVLAPAQWSYIGPQPAATLVQLAFATAPGQTYQVQYKDHIDDPEWLPLGAPVAGDGNTWTITDDLAAWTQRFYRLAILP